MILATDFNNNISNVPGGFIPLTVNTPLDGRIRVNTESDILNIPKPYVGMIVYVVDTGKRFEILSLKSKQVGLKVIENALVNEYRELAIGDLTGYATEDYVNEAISNVATGDVDLTGYAKTSDIPTKTSQLTNDSSFATETYVTDKISEASLGGGNGSSVNLSEYQKITDNTLTTTSKQIPGAINEIKADVDSINPDNIVYFENNTEASDVDIKASNIQVTDSGNKLNSNNVEDALIEINDKINTTAYTLPKATSSTLGGIKVGSGLTISTDGTLNSSAVNYTLPTASSSTLGGIKVGSGLSISNGVLNNAYTIPKATSSTLGGIKIGNGLSIDSAGVVSVTGGGSGDYTLPTASATRLGGVKVGSGLSIDSNGILSSTAGGSYTLPAATATTLGGIKVGSGLTINNGVLSATATSSGSGGVVGINPDSYSGTDYQKLQSAITAACNLALSDVPSEIVLNRIYNITGQGSLKWTNNYYKTAMVIYVTGHAGGGIKKTDAGYMFEGGSGVGNLYGTYFTDVYFESKAGAGTIIFNGRHFLGSVWTNCSFRNVDTVMYTPSYVQTMRFQGCTIRGGQGNCFDYAGLYDCTFSDLIIETRGGVIFNQRDVSATANNFLYAVRWRDCLIEGISGTCFIFKNITTATLNGTYMEENTNNIVFRAGSSITNIEICNTYYYGSKSGALIQWAGTIANAFSHNNYCLGQPLHDTSKLTSAGGLVTLGEYSSKPQLGTIKPRSL